MCRIAEAGSKGSFWEHDWVGRVGKHVHAVQGQQLQNLDSAMGMLRRGLILSPAAFSLGIS